MEKEYLIMDEFELVYDKPVAPEPKEESDGIIAEVMKEFGLEE